VTLAPRPVECVPAARRAVGWMTRSLSDLRPADRPMRRIIYPFCTAVRSPSQSVRARTRTKGLNATADGRATDLLSCRIAGVARNPPPSIQNAGQYPRPPDGTGCLIEAVTFSSPPAGAANADDTVPIRPEVQPAPVLTGLISRCPCPS